MPNHRRLHNSGSLSAAYQRRLVTGDKRYILLCDSDRNSILRIYTLINARSLQGTRDHLLRGRPFAPCYLDRIFFTTSDDRDQCFQHLQQFLSILSFVKLRINPNKYVLGRNAPPLQMVSNRFTQNLSHRGFFKARGSFRISSISWNA